MARILRSQVGRKVQPQTSNHHTILGHSAAPSRAGLFVPSSAVRESVSSDQLDRVVNAYVDGSSLVVICDIDGTRKAKRLKAEYSCFLRRDEDGVTFVYEDLRRMLRDSPAVVAMRDEGGWTRVCWRDAKIRRKYCKLLLENHVWTYDGNVDPFCRFMLDNPRATIVTGRKGFLDFETDSRVPFSRLNEMRILSWAVVCDAGEFVRVLEDDTDFAEAKLLSDLFELLNGIDQVLAWNGDKFDFPLLVARSLQRGLRPTFDRWLWLDHMKLFERMNTMAAESGDEKQSMALDSIAEAVLGERKLPFDASKTWEKWAAGGEDRLELGRYNLRDSQLMAMLEAKTGYVALLDSLAAVCAVRPDSRGMLPTVQVESLLQRLASENGMRFETAYRSRSKDDDSAKFRGAYVMEPAVRGIVKNVHVADFSSLYPSIIRTWNMSAETKSFQKIDPARAIDECVEQGRRVSYCPDDKCVAPITGVVFSKAPVGLLSGAVAMMMKMRKEWNDKKAAATPGTPEWVDADRRSTAYKIAANSCYGAIGKPSFMHYDVDVAESVSQAGVWLIKQTIKAAEERGLQVVYSDTDSILVMGCTNDEFSEFVAWCNNTLYPGVLRLLGCEPGLINLAYEKAFERIVLISKKRYCGRYSHYKGTIATDDSKPEVKGLEYKRGDSIRLARQMQGEVVGLLVGQTTGGIEDPERYEKVLHRWRDHIADDELGLEEVVISKSLGKDLKSYATRLKKDGTPARQLPHIEVAKILQLRGRDVGQGTRIDYVVRDGSKKPIDVIPAEDWTGEVDRREVWENLTAPATMRVLEAAFPGWNWKPWYKFPDRGATLFD